MEQKDSFIHYENLPFSARNTWSSLYIFHRKCSIDEKTVFPAHWHESIELLAFLQGPATVTVDFAPYTVGAGDIVCVNSEKIHHIAAAEKIHYHTLIVNRSLLEWLDLPTDIRFEPVIRDEKIFGLFEDVAAEIKANAPYHPITETGDVILLLSLLCRNHRCEGPEKAVHASSHELVKEALGYIRLHYLEDVSTAEIGSRLCVTTNYLCTVFRQVTGTTVKKYINSLRCKDAESLLAAGKLSVKEIAGRCGFNNLSYFAKTYRSVIGVSPSETARTKHTV